MFFFIINSYPSSLISLFYIMYSYILDILLFIVLSYYVFGEQFLYGNSVFRYCFKKYN